MIAYLFWHRPRPDLDPADYERLLRDFHRVLAEAAPAGFLASAAFATGDGYEDWYLLDGSAALDDLEEAAVAGPCKEFHDAVAAGSADGAGGLYRLREGPSSIAGPASWSSTRPSVPAGASLWQRRLALGPKPEFCLVGAGDPVTRRPVWP